MKIFRDFDFEAAHRLPNVPSAHKCYHLHGHHYRVRIMVDGPLHPELGWVMDFASFDGLAELVKSYCDHKYLNDVEGLENPTAENIAQWILERCRTTIFPVTSITVWETADTGAIAE